VRLARPRWLLIVRASSDPALLVSNAISSSKHRCRLGVFLSPMIALADYWRFGQRVRMLGTEDLFFQGDHFAILGGGIGCLPAACI